MAALLSLILAISITPHGREVHLPPRPSVTTVDVGQEYLVEATLDVAAGRMTAVETVTLTNRAALPIGYLNLSIPPAAFGYVRLGEVTFDGEPARVQWTTTTNLRVDLPQRLPARGSGDLRLAFDMTVGASGGAFTARTSRDRGVLSLGQWLPMVSPEHDSYAVGDPRITRSADRIRLVLTTTAAQPRHAVACAGLREAPATSGTRWVCEIEHARDIGLVVNPRFRYTERVVDGITMRVYTETVTGTRTADLAEFALTRLNALLGRYPWPDLVLAEVGADGGFSMEYPASIHLTRTKVVDTYVLYHEVAHQWFYAQLGNDQMREPWLDEGFADFTTRYLMGTGESQCSGRPIDSPVFDWPAGRTTGGDWQSCDGYFHTVFYKTTEFLNQVRAAMGEDAFFAALRGHIAANRFGVTTASRLLDDLQAGTDVDLTPIFARYLAAY